MTDQGLLCGEGKKYIVNKSFKYQECLHNQGVTRKTSAKKHRMIKTTVKYYDSTEAMMPEGEKHWGGQQ